MLWASLHYRSLRTSILPLCRRNIFHTPRSQFPRLGRFSNNPPNSPQDVPTFRDEVIRATPIQSFREGLRPGIKNQILFFGAGSVMVFTYAAWRTNFETAEWSAQLRGISWTNRGPTSDEMKRAQYFELGKELQGWVHSISNATFLPLAMKRLLAQGYAIVAQPYLDSTEGRRICWKIIAFNTAVWFAWQLPRLRSAMNASFMHHPLSGMSYTLLTSVFSHRSFFHLLFNSMALSSFGSAAAHYFSRQQDKAPSGLQESTTTYHFLAFFVSAGMFSSLVSHLVNARFVYPRLVTQIASNSTSSAATSTASTLATTAGKIAAKNTPIGEILPSLGSSGAIYGAVTLTALAFPDLHIALIIPPSFPIPIQYGVGGMVLLDCIGVMRGWRIFDHYAHLGGAVFGAGYYVFGPQFWDSLRAGVGGGRTWKERDGG